MFSAARAAVPQGKGSVLAAKAAETKGKGSVLTARAVEAQRQSSNKPYILGILSYMHIIYKIYT